MVPTNLSLFHITAIPNLPDMAVRGALMCKNAVVASGVKHANIAYQGVQLRRANKVVTAGPGGVVHDYVPFYFAPRSPMLMAINSGRVEGCEYRQDDIVHLRASLDRTLASGLPYVFYDINAAVSTAECFDDVAELGRINWPLFFEQPLMDGYCKYWMNIHANPKYVQRMETRQAEFLIHGRFPLSLIDEIVTRTESTAATVRKIVQKAGWRVSVRAQPLWYF